jgi:hypothetical protein
MPNRGVSYLALGIGLLTETSFAFGQAPSPTLVAQVTGTVPPSGVLTTQPPAPVAVPPSGFLATVERGVSTTTPFKTAQKLSNTKRATPVRTRRHVVHWRSATRAKTATPTSTVDQSVAATPSVVRTTPEQPRPDGIGYELFLPQLGKGK